MYLYRITNSRKGFVATVSAVAAIVLLSCGKEQSPKTPAVTKASAVAVGEVATTPSTAVAAQATLPTAPVVLPKHDPPVKFVQVAVGDGFACALREDGGIECKGKNDHGQADPVDGSFSKIVVFHNGGYGLERDGKVRYWGRSESYQSPDGLAGKGLYIDMARFDGYGGFCGVRTDGSLDCLWNSSAFPPPHGNFQQVSIGSRPCALGVDGVARCWGKLEGGCGIGQKSNNKATPPTTVKFRSIAIGCSMSCGLTQDGAVKCWGESWAERAAPKGTFKQVAAGGWNACGVRLDGRIECWGKESTPSGVLDPPDGTFAHVAIQDRTACAVRDEGSIVCWGSGLVGNWPQLPHEQVAQRHCSEWATSITNSDGDFVGTMRSSSLEGCEGHRRGFLSGGAEKATPCKCDKDQNGESW